jgi:hypothetical protein
MNKADRVRLHASEMYIYPARMRGESQVTIVAGEAAKALSLSNRMPLVCGALGTLKFQEECKLRLVSRTGPGQGARATFTFGLI